MLTNDQIQYLFTFCEKHYVRYYDLQVELVDHLATAIEHKMQLDTKLDFEIALKQVYAGFGILGFSSIISQKQTALQKMHIKSFWREMHRYCMFPRIILTFFIYCIIYLPFTLNLQAQKILLSYNVLIALVAISVLISSLIKYKNPRKKLLILDSNHILPVTGALFQLILQFYLFQKFYDISHYLQLIIIAYTVGIITFLALYARFKKTYQEAKNKYPLAFSK